MSALLAAAAVGAAACGSSSSKAAQPKASTVTSATKGKSDCTSSNGSVTRVAGPYTMVATLGPDEMMYTQAEVDSQHPTSGEVMLRGSMTGDQSTPLATTPMQPGTDNTNPPGNVVTTTTAMGGSGTGDATTPTTVAPDSAGMESSMTTAPMTAAPGGAMAVTRHLEVHICTTATGKVVVNANPTITLGVASGHADMSVDVAEMQGIGEGTADVHYGNNVSVQQGQQYAITVKLGDSIGRFTITA